MATVICMNDLIQKAPFEGVDSQYRSIDDMLGYEISILDTKFFENDKGEGAYVLCDDGHDLFHICTHSIGLIANLKNEKVQEAIGEGVPIKTKIVKRKSTKSDRMVYSFA